MYMNKIGNIIVSNINVRTNIWMNKCLSLNDIDKSIPTLILGLEKARSLITDFNILKKTYNNGMLWWTFNKSEKRSENIEDNENFINFCIEKLTNNTKYNLIDIINIKYSQVKSFYNIISNNERKYFYNDNNKFIYLYNTMNNTVYGISLDTCEYCGISKKKILDKIGKLENITEITDFAVIPMDMRNRINDNILSKLVLFEAII